MVVSQPSSIKSLILLMLFSVVCAMAISIFSIQKFGPIGAYEVKNALITPYLLENMSYDDVDTKTGAPTRFVFDQLLFTYTDSVTQKEVTLPVTLEKYRLFYDTIISDSSVNDTTSLASLFDGANPPKLIVKVKTVAQDALQRESEVFQEIQYANEGNFYRIELREELNPQAEWAYYNHPGIKNKIFNLFAEK